MYFIFFFFYVLKESLKFVLTSKEKSTRLKKILLNFISLCAKVIWIICVCVEWVICFYPSGVFRAVVPLVATPSKVSAQVPLLDQPWNLEFMPFNLGFTVGCPEMKPLSCLPNMGQWMGKISYIHIYVFMCEWNALLDWILSYL